MEVFGGLLEQYGWPGVIVALVIFAGFMFARGWIVPKSWVDRWLDDKDKIIDRSFAAFDKLSDAVEKNTDTVQQSAVEQAKSLDQALQSIQRMGNDRDRDRGDSR